ncbi:MAG: hypothetical protein M0R40_03295 [Firmicutes bacterium]|nr:hypothetical protein [Bacillota bacterium]
MKEKSNLKIKENAYIKKSNLKWVITITTWTLFTSVMLAFISDYIMPKAHIVAAIAVLFMFISIGIVFDMVGLAIATANEQPFHSMGSRKIIGTKQAVSLIRNAEKASSLCNDVVGDIAGIISGSTTAAIVLRFAALYGADSIMLSLIVTGFVAALTVGGKAMGKAFAISHANRITYAVALLWYYIGGFLKKRRAK